MCHRHRSVRSAVDKFQRFRRKRVDFPLRVNDFAKYILFSNNKSRIVSIYFVLNRTHYIAVFDVRVVLAFSALKIMPSHGRNLSQDDTVLHNRATFDNRFFFFSKYIRLFCRLSQSNNCKNSILPKPQNKLYCLNGFTR